MKKGLELPINMLVIIAIAVLILVVVALFFTGFFGEKSGAINLAVAYSNACETYRSVYNCGRDSTSIGFTVVGYQIPGGGTGNARFIDVCNEKYEEKTAGTPYTPIDFCRKDCCGIPLEP